MAYTATALLRGDRGWSARDVDLAEVDDLDAAADLLRDEAEGAVALLLVEENDEYLGILRVRGEDDPRIFISDVRALETSQLAGRLFADARPAPAVPDEDPRDDEDETGRPEADPAGDATLLADLGTPGPTLARLCAEEGMLPSDIVYAICENAGCVEALEEVRGGV